MYVDKMMKLTKPHTQTSKRLVWLWRDSRVIIKLLSYTRENDNIHCYNTSKDDY